VTTSTDVALIVVLYESDRHVKQNLSGWVRSFAQVVLVDHSPTSLSKLTVGFGQRSVTYVRRGRNRGFGSGVNYGMSLVSPGIDYVFIGNPDLAIESHDDIQSLVGYLQVNPSIGVLAANLVYPDGRPQYVGRPFPSLRYMRSRFRSGFGGERPGLQLSAAKAISPLHPGLTTHDWVIGASMTVRRNEFQSIGGFDERFFMYGEDVDLCWRYRQHGFEIAQAEDVQLVHEYAQTSGSKMRLHQPLVRQHWASIAKLAIRYPVTFLTR